MAVIFLLLQGQPATHTDASANFKKQVVQHPAAEALKAQPEAVEQPQSPQVAEVKVQETAPQAPVVPEPKPTETEPQISATSPQDIVKQMAAAKGWTGYQWESLKELVHNESTWQPHAVNPSSGACGLFQALPCSKISDPTSIKSQADFGLSYIADRYGSPALALTAWQARYPHWY